MLVLTRRFGETVIIGQAVTVTVLGVNGNQVRVGVEAPNTVAVHREEISSGSSAMIRIRTALLNRAGAP